MKKIIGTHNGTFHCDEALAVFLLLQTDAYANADVKRTRDPSLLSACDIVVDVGAVYDEKKQLFDHHQRGFEEVFGWGFSTKLSSAGLIYKHFGKEIVAKVMKLPADEPKVEVLWVKLYKEFIEAIDAIDNGISQYPPEISPRYHSKTDLASRVGRLNPPWNKPSDACFVDSQFAQASSLTGSEFMERLNYHADAWLPARDLVIKALDERLSIDPSGKILFFEQFCPWKEHIFELEGLASGSPSKPHIIYVVYLDDTSGTYRVQAVAIDVGSFESRKALPEAWRGLRDDELSKVSGVEGGIFVHASGFIGGNKTKAGALAMAKLALSS